MENNENNLKLKECGQCDCFHKPGYTGDCRDDYNRYADWQDTLSIGEERDENGVGM